MELVSRYPSDAQIFNLASRFWENLSTPHVAYAQALWCEEYTANISANKNVYYSFKYHQN